MNILTKFLYNSDSQAPSTPPSLNIKNVLFACFASIVLVVLSYGGFLIVMTLPVTRYSIESAGTFGDSFGALNSLFTGLGFAGLLVTIFLQREDLKLTRLELSETRNEIKSQSETFRQQQFEESFYRLLTLYKANLEQVSVKSGRTPEERIHGVTALRQKQKKFDEACATQRGLQFPSAEKPQEQEDYAYHLYLICNSNLPQQARYMETLSSLLMLIEKDCYSASRREYYLNILSSQFTTHEVKYMFYQAFLNPNYSALRNTLKNSPSFQERFSVDSIPHGHYACFEYLWQIPVGNSRSNNDRLFSTGRFKDAKARARIKPQVNLHDHNA
ncbi:hypothetical protein LZ838_01755 [Pseudomonas sp. AA27]|uniref:hypothetical protein n=1 Tax=Pseudomonas sp. AA27 TaxID=2908652 RepID=UPI001F27D243|nr:hypothetical protein [Pseudomonas sp. AA27]MCF1486082.1 hypothetical protein [Pseudomonas sp. AA27]